MLTSQGELSPGSQPLPNTNDTPPQVHDQTGGGTHNDQRELEVVDGIPSNLNQVQVYPLWSIFNSKVSGRTITNLHLVLQNRIGVEEKETRSRICISIAKALITATTSGSDVTTPFDGSDDDAKTATINAVTRSQTKGLAMPRSDEPSPLPIPTPAEVMASGAPGSDVLIFNVEAPEPVLHQHDGAGFETEPPVIDNDNYWREPSFSEKLAIVKRYHRLSHQRDQTLLSLLRNTGRYRWRDLTQMVELVSGYCKHCELKQQARKGYHPLRSNRSKFAGDVWVADLITLPRYQDEQEGDAAKVMDLIANAVTVTSAPYHPQSQGDNERKHRDIRMDIIALLTEQTEIPHWKATVSFVQWEQILKCIKNRDQHLLQFTLDEPIICLILAKRIPRLSHGGITLNTTVIMLFPNLTRKWAGTLIIKNTSLIKTMRRT